MPVEGVRDAHERVATRLRVLGEARRNARPHAHVGVRAQFRVARPHVTRVVDALSLLRVVVVGLQKSEHDLHTHTHTHTAAAVRLGVR